MLGHEDFNNFQANDGGNVNAAVLNFGGGGGISTDGVRLVVGDRSNHRVLIWESIPTKTFTPADYVLGQNSFTSADLNQNGIGPHSMNFPFPVFLDGNRLFVAEEGNNRVTIFNLGGQERLILAHNLAREKLWLEKCFSTGTATESKRTLETRP